MAPALSWFLIRGGPPCPSVVKKVCTWSRDQFPPSTDRGSVKPGRRESRKGTYRGEVETQVMRWDEMKMFTEYNVYWGRRLIGISGSLIRSKTLMELIFNPCGEFRWSPKGPVSQIHSLHLVVGAPGIFSDLLKSVQMLKREWGAESSGTLPYLWIPGKTATLVPEIAVEDVPHQNCSLGFCACSKMFRSWAEHSDDDD